MKAIKENELHIEILWAIFVGFDLLDVKSIVWGPAGRKSIKQNTAKVIQSQVYTNSHSLFKLEKSFTYPFEVSHPRKTLLYILHHDRNAAFNASFRNLKYDSPEPSRG